MPKLYIEIDRQGSLFFLLDALIGAYNRRTDALMRQQESSDLEEIKDRIDKADQKLKEKKHGN